MAQDTPRPSSQHKGDVFASEKQRTGSKRQKQGTEDEREGEGDKGEGTGVFVPWEDKGLPLNREKKDKANGGL